MLVENPQNNQEKSAYDFVTKGKPVPPEVHKATIKRAREIPGSNIIPEDFDEGTGILHFGMRHKMDRWNGGIE